MLLLVYYLLSLFPLFFQVLEKDIGEIVPYVFQIMSLLLQQQGGCPDTYLELYKPLLSPQLWEASGNVQPLVTLLCVIIERCPSKPSEKVSTKFRVNFRNKILSSILFLVFSKNLLLHELMMSMDSSCSRLLFAFFQKKSSKNTSRAFLSVNTHFGIF